MLLQAGWNQKAQSTELGLTWKVSVRFHHLYQHHHLHEHSHPHHHHLKNPQYYLTAVSVTGSMGRALRLRLCWFSVPYLSYPLCGLYPLLLYALWWLYPLLLLYSFLVPCPLKFKLRSFETVLTLCPTSWNDKLINVNEAVCVSQRSSFPI